MEPTEGGNQTAAGITAGALSSLSDGIASVESVLSDLRSSATADVESAESALTGVVALLSGAAENELDRAEQPLVKYLSKVRDQASADHQAAINRLFTVGARPLYVTGEMLADMERGDITASAVEQILAPIADALKEQIAPVPGMEIGTTPGGPAPLPIQEPAPVLPADPFPPFVPPSPPPPPPPAPTVPPGCCPPAQITVAPCPAPVVHVHAPWVRPLPEQLPDWWPTEPTSPPASPPPPPVEDSDGEDSTPDTAPPPAPPEQAPPPRPVAPPRGYVPRPAQTVTSPQYPMDGWDGPERCATLSGGVIPGPVSPDEWVSAFAAASLAVARTADVIARAELAAANPQITPEELEKYKPNEERALADARDALSRLRNDVPKGGDLTDRAMIALGSAAKMQERTSAPFSYLAQGWLYDLQYSAPQYLPSQSQVDGMLLAGVINQELWTCLTRANGNKVWAAELAVRSQRQRPNLNQWISLYRKGLLSELDLYKRAQENGWTDPVEVKAVVQDSEFVPPYSDVVRMMVRDSADEDAVRSAGFDNDFEEKYRGQLRAWAESQGISEDVMRYIWRAHWELPSPTALYEMLHRLRPGRVPPGVAVDAELVKATLKQNDVAPGYVDRMIAISYNVLTRTDLLTFYSNGSMDKQEVIERLQDTGYNLADATRIADAWELEKANRQANRSRVWSRTNILKHYRRGSITAQYADDLLSRTIPDANERAQILIDADNLRASDRLDKCIRAVRKRYMSGDIDDQAARDQLRALEVDPRHILPIVDGWVCERQSAEKQPTLAMLSDWLERGIINIDQYQTRLGGLGYRPLDVQRITAEVVSDITERRARQAAAAAKAAAREDERRRKEAERIAEKRRKDAAAAIKDAAEAMGGQ